MNNIKINLDVFVMQVVLKHKFKEKRKLLFKELLKINFTVMVRNLLIECYTFSSKINTDD
jgi:hypothetical protein